MIKKVLEIFKIIILCISNFFKNIYTKVKPFLLSCKRFLIKVGKGIVTFIKRKKKTSILIAIGILLVLLITIFLCIIFRDREDEFSTTHIPVNGVTILEDTNIIYLDEVGDEYQLKWEVQPSNAYNKNVKWTSNNNDIVSVSENGLLRLENYKTEEDEDVLITVETIDGGYKDSIYVVAPIDYKYDSLINDYLDLYTVNINNSDVRVFKGLKLVLSDKVHISSILKELNINESYEFVWDSSNDGIVTVDYNKLTGETDITCLSTGKTILTLKCYNEFNELIVNKSFEINVVLEDVYEITYSGLNDEYYQGEIINNSLISLNIKYRNARGQNLERSIKYTDLFASEILDTYQSGKCVKVLSYQECEFKIEYNVIATNVTNFEVVGLVSEYVVFSSVDAKVIIELDNGLSFTYNLSDVTSNLRNIDMSISGEKSLVIDYFNQLYVYDFIVINKEVIEKNITGLNVEYPVNSIIDYSKVLIDVKYNQEYNTLNAFYKDINGSLLDFYSIDELNKLFDNSSIGKKNITLLIGDYQEKIEIEYNVIDAIVNVSSLDFIIPIKEEYFLNEVVLLNINPNYNGYTLNNSINENLKIYKSGLLTSVDEITSSTGTFELQFIYGDYMVSFDIKVVSNYIINYYDEENNIISYKMDKLEYNFNNEIELDIVTGYEFDRLETDNDVICSYVDGKLYFTSFEKDENTTIDIYYKKSTFKVIYNITGYDAHIDTYKYQEEIVEYVPEDLVGFVFTGWNKEIPQYMPGYDIVVYGSYITESSGLYSIKFYLEDFEGNYYLEEINNCIIVSGIGANFEVSCEDEKVNIKVIDNNQNLQKEIIKEYVGFNYNRYEIIDNVCSVYFSIKSYSIIYNLDEEEYIFNYKYRQSVDNFEPIKFGYTLVWDQEIPTYMPDYDLVVKGIYYANTYNVTLINGDTHLYYQYKCDEILNLPILTDDVNEFIGWQDENGIIYEVMVWYDLVLTPVWKEYSKIISYEVNGLESSYLTGSVIDVDNIYVTFTFIDNSKETYKLLDVLVSGDFNTDNNGLKELLIKCENQEFKLYYEITDVVREIVDVEIENFPKYFYYLDDVSLNDYLLKITYNDSVARVPLNSSNVIISGFDLTSIGTKTLLVTYYSEVVSIAYEVVNPIYVTENEVLILDNQYTFTVVIDESLVDNNYLLELLDINDYKYEIINNGNGIYRITIKLNEGVDAVSVRIGLDCLSCYEVVNITKLNLEDLEIIIEGNNYGFVGKVISISSKLSYNGVKYAMDGAIFNWSISGEGVLSYNDNYCQITISDIGIVTITLTVEINGFVKTVTKDIELINPYEGIRFIENKTYGIGEVLTLGGFRYKNSVISNELVSKLYTFDIISKTNVNIDDLVWFTSDESIASFGYNGELNIHGDGYVTLYVTSKSAYKYGLSSSTYIGSFTVRCVYDAVYVTTYNDIVKAFGDNKQVVLGNSIDIGETVMTLVTDNSGNVVREKISNVDVKSLVKSSVKQIESTWDCDYLINTAKHSTFKANVNYCLEITNNLYGNGYTLDCYQITTASSIDSSVNVFNGPLEFISIMDAAAVYGQDNIGFLIRDDVTVDNVVLQNCDDGYLYENGLYVYSKLEKVGTTVEVMGDNVNIINSRIRNGRNTLRIYGSENPDEVINVRVESSIISNAREFLVKIGANKSIDANCQVTYNGEKVYVRDLYDKYGMTTKEVSSYIKSDSELYEELFTSCSPYLLKEDGSRYKIRDNSNQYDEYFINNYIKTNVTMKNCVLTNTGFYAIGMESKFSGPILGGFRYAPKDIEISDYPGAYNISGTSYAALLTLEGDVRIYNWKKLSDIDSTSIMERLENADIIENMGFDFTFRVNELIKNVSQTEGYENIISNNSSGEYAHGGVAFYGGGKNYHMINFDNYIGYQFTRYAIPFSSLGDGLFSQTLPWAAGREPFVFYMYDSQSEFSYDYQTSQIESGNAYNWIEPVQ